MKLHSITNLNIGCQNDFPQLLLAADEVQKPWLFIQQIN